MYTHVSILWVKGCQLFRNFLWYVIHHKTFGLVLKVFNEEHKHITFIIDDIYILFYHCFYDILCLVDLWFSLHTPNKFLEMFPPVSGTYFTYIYVLILSMRVRSNKVRSLLITKIRSELILQSSCCSTIHTLLFYHHSSHL